MDRNNTYEQAGSSGAPSTPSWPSWRRSQGKRCLQSPAIAAEPRACRTAAIAQATSAERLDLAARWNRRYRSSWRSPPVGRMGHALRKAVVSRSWQLSRLSSRLVDRQAEFRSPECECPRRSTPPALVIYPCTRPVRSRPGLGNGRSPACMHSAAVDRTSVLGVLNLACDDPLFLTSRSSPSGRHRPAIGRGHRKRTPLGRAEAAGPPAQPDAGAGHRRPGGRAETHRPQATRPDRQALTRSGVAARLEAEADGSAGLTISPDRLQELKTVVADTLMACGIWLWSCAPACWTTLAGAGAPAHRAHLPGRHSWPSTFRR